jgi:serine/threonine-protein kinase RsbW
VTDTVTLIFAADTRNVALARTLAAAMAARADLPLDQLEDLRLAVDEAVTQILSTAPPDADVACEFRIDGHRVHVQIAASTTATSIPSTTSFGWTVLSALVDSVEARLSNGELSISFSVSRDLVGV